MLSFLSSKTYELSCLQTRNNLCLMYKFFPALSWAFLFSRDWANTCLDDLFVRRWTTGNWNTNERDRWVFEQHFVLSRYYQILAWNIMPIWSVRILGKTLYCYRLLKTSFKNVRRWTAKIRDLFIHKQLGDVTKSARVLKLSYISDTKLRGTISHNPNVVIQTMFYLKLVIR